MVAYTKSRSDLELELAEQIEALHDSSAAYDNGKFWEAKRLAATAFILLHDGGRRSQSLLTQLDLKRGMRFWSTVKPAEANSPLPLCVINIDIPKGICTYSPFLDEHSNHRVEMKFSKWYAEPVFVLDSGKRLSRMNLIYALRNQLGGGHVDNHIENEAVHWLTRGAHFIGSDAGWRDEQGNILGSVPFAAPIKTGPISNGHYATMRQIAWEMQLSFSALRQE